MPGLPLIAPLQPSEVTGPSPGGLPTPVPDSAAPLILPQLERRSLLPYLNGGAGWGRGWGHFPQDPLRERATLPVPLGKCGLTPPLPSSRAHLGKVPDAAWEHPCSRDRQQVHSIWAQQTTIPSLSRGGGGGGGGEEMAT